MSPLMILNPLEKPMDAAPSVHGRALLTDCGTFIFYIRQPAEYVINTSLFAIALACHNTC